MDEKDFEGTSVLEQLAAIGRVEDFFVAFSARLRPNVVLKIRDADGEH